MDTLLTTAIVGTAQHTSANSTTGTSVDTLIAQLTGAEDERKLLLTAGALAVYQRAGHRAGAAPEAPQPAAPERLKRCPVSIDPLLEDLLEGNDSELRPEAFALLKRSALHLPYELLPLALTCGAQSVEARDGLYPLLGERGRWLSRFNPAWAWVSDYLDESDQSLPAHAETLWQEGTTGQRSELLQRLRAVDPQQARDWLKNVWKQEKADARLQLLSAFTAALSINDEAFLEQALDDRSEKVRTLAATLLKRIPNSALLQRLQARADRVLIFSAGKFSGGKLDITLPAPSENEGTRDGIPPLNSKQGQQDQQWWAQQVLSAIPPEHWEQHFGLSINKLIKLASANKQWSYLILESWTQATRLHNSQQWILPLWDWWHKTMNKSHEDIHTEALSSLTALLPQQVAEEKIQQLDTKSNAWLAALHVLPKPWSHEFGTLYLQSLRDHVKTLGKHNESPYSDRLFNSLITGATALPLTCFDSALKPWQLPEGKHWYIHYWQSQLNKFIKLINSRKTLLKELS